MFTEANKENVFHVTKDTSGAGRGDDPQDPQVLLSSPATQVCFEEPQPSTSTSDLFPTASTSSMEPTSAGRGPPSSSSENGGLGAVATVLSIHSSCPVLLRGQTSTEEFSGGVRHQAVSSKVSVAVAVLFHPQEKAWG